MINAEPKFRNLMIILVIELFVLDPVLMYDGHTCVQIIPN